MPKRVLFALPAAVVLILVGADPSWSRVAVAGGSGVIAAVPGTSTTYTLEVTNTGAPAMLGTSSAPLQCLRFLAADGVQLASVDAPSGTQTALIPGRGFSATLEPPLQLNASLTWTFTTGAPYPVNGSGTLTVSADCSQDVAGTVSGPAAAAGTTPGTTTAPAAGTTNGQPCACARLRVSIRPADVYTAAAQLAPEGDPRARLGALATWSMACSAGTGDCSAGITVVPPPGDTVRVFAPARFVPRTGPYRGRSLYRKGRPLALTFACKGPCSATTGGSFFVQLDSRSALPGKTVRLRLRLRCTTGSTQTLTFAFRANGGLDRARSVLR